MSSTNSELTSATVQNIIQTVYAKSMDKEFLARPIADAISPQIILTASARMQKPDETNEAFEDRKKVASNKIFEGLGITTVKDLVTKNPGSPKWLHLTPGWTTNKANAVESELQAKGLYLSMITYPSGHVAMDIQATAKPDGYDFEVDKSDMALSFPPGAVIYFARDKEARLFKFALGSALPFLRNECDLIGKSEDGRYNLYLTNNAIRTIAGEPQIVAEALKQASISQDRQR